MLFTTDAWPRIADGTITVTFRTWKRPQAKPGGTYRVGGISIEATDVRQVRQVDISEGDARAAGEADRAALLRRLGVDDPDALVWRVEFHLAGRDDRAVLREQAEVSDDELAVIRARLDRLDRASGGREWTRSTLRLIEKYPGIVSTVLARHAGRDRAAFKTDVRKLKELGLTESLEVGYRLSPRGEAVLRRL